MSRTLRAAIRIPHRRILTSGNLTPRPANHGGTPEAISSDPGETRINRGDGFFNTADRIEEQLLDEGHRLWGLAIYRCTYGDSAAWAKCLERLRSSIRESMHYHSALELLDEGRFKLTIFDDVGKFDGADAHLVRQSFKEWRKHALHEEQGSLEEIKVRRGHSESHWRNDWAVRYKFCVQIDEAALQSILSPEAEDRGEDAWVNLIEGDWDPNAAAAIREQDRIWHIESDLDPDTIGDCEELFPEIDGCIDENIGWMKVQYQDVIPCFYAQLSDSDNLEYLYRRPPNMASA